MSRTDVTKNASTHLVVYISDVHDEVNIIAEIIGENASKDILRYIVSMEGKFSRALGAVGSCPHRACPI